MRRLLLFLFFIPFFSCQESDLPPNCKIIRPENDSEFLLGDSIVISVEATDPGGYIDEILLYFDGFGIKSMKEFPYIATIGTDKYGPGTFKIKATALDGDGQQMSDEIQIVINSQLASIVTNKVILITDSSAMCGGSVMSDGGTEITAKGVCWSLYANPTTSDNHTINGSGPGSFASALVGLECSSTYYVRAYVTNTAGTAYGNEIEFQTGVCPVRVPTVITTPIIDAGENRATGGGSVINDGGGLIMARGVCWSTSQHPTLSDNYTTDGTGLGAYTSNISGLRCATTYYARAYATNYAGTAYGDQVTFETGQCTAFIPTISTTPVSNISGTSAHSGGNITDDGGASVTERGICWSISDLPTVSDNRTNDGTGTGIYASIIPGLSCNTKYYIRAYATNRVGTGYGDQESFTTPECSFLPEVSTFPISSVTDNSAKSGGNVTTDGGMNVTAKGVCWSTADNPSVSDSHTVDGSGTGIYTSTVTGLNANTVYYIRAYATNDSGTSYGNQYVFRTK